MIRRKRANSIIGPARLTGWSGLRMIGTPVSTYFISALSGSVNVANATGHDVILVAVHCINGYTVLSVTSAGMTFTSLNNMGNSRPAVFYGIVPDSTNPRSVTVNMDAAISTSALITVSLLRAVDNVTPIDVADATDTSFVAADPIVVPEITTTIGRSVAFAVLNTNDDNSIDITSSPGWALASTYVGHTAMAASLSIAYKEVYVAGGSGDCTFDLVTNGPDSGKYFRFAFRAAP